MLLSFEGAGVVGGPKTLDPKDHAIVKAENVGVVVGAVSLKVIAVAKRAINMMEDVVHHTGGGSVG